MNNEATDIVTALRESDGFRIFETSVEPGHGDNGGDTLRSIGADTPLMRSAANYIEHLREALKSKQTSSQPTFGLMFTDDGIEVRAEYPPLTLGIHKNYADAKAHVERLQKEKERINSEHATPKTPDEQ